MFCTAELLYFTLYDEVYENASTFIHHPLYHPSVFQLSCYSDIAFDSPRRWIIFSANDNSLVANIDIPGNTAIDVTIDGVIVPVTIQASDITVDSNRSVTTLQVSHVIPGNFVCQSNDFSLVLRIVTGTYASKTFMHGLNGHNICLHMYIALYLCYDFHKNGFPDT